MPDAEPRRRGRPPLDPASRTVTLTLHLPKNQLDAVRERARLDRKSVPEYVRDRLTVTRYDNPAKT